MSYFLNKWAAAGAASTKDLSLPKPAASSASATPPLSAAKAGKPAPQAAAQANTLPQSMAPSALLPSVSNQAAAVSQVNSGDVSTNTSSGNYAKMAQATRFGIMLDLMTSGSMTRNLLNMRPR
jgi:hypothetical protein